MSNSIHIAYRFEFSNNYNHNLSIEFNVFVKMEQTSQDTYNVDKHTPWPSIIKKKDPLLTHFLRVYLELNFVKLNDVMSKVLSTKQNHY